MKHYGCILHFTKERNDELMKAYRKALSEQSFIQNKVIGEIVANTPCSRFWISEERAMAVISALDNGRPILDTMRPLKREMFIEIYKRVNQMRLEKPNLALFDIIILVVNSPAPKFYLEPRSVMEFICKIKNGYYDRHRGR